MRVLICVGGGVGNVVMATPMIAAVASLGATVDVFCHARGCSWKLIESWDAVDRVFGDSAEEEMLDTRYDAVTWSVWGRPPEDVWAGARIAPDPVDLRRCHESEACMTAARRMGFAGATPPPHVEAAPRRELARRHDLSRRFVAVCPGVGSPGPGWDRKLWPHWSAFIRGLLPRGREVVVLGAPRDRDLALGHDPDQPPPGLRDLRGETPLLGAAGLLREAQAVVAVDNGLAHVAAALGAQTHVLFGFTSEAKNRPLGPRVTVHAAPLPCRPCQMTPREKTCEAARCMEGIEPEAVLAGL